VTATTCVVPLVIVAQPETSNAKRRIDRLRISYTPIPTVDALTTAARTQGGPLNNR
jgi:hypothetical protein